MINSAYDFLYRGKKITTEQAAMVYNPGSKGYYTLSQLAGGNQDLLGVLQAGVVARAKGGGKALTADTLGSAQKSLDLMGVGKDSPMRALFKFNTSENKVLQNTQQGLVGGYNAGLGGATALNNAFAGVASAAQGVTNALMGLKGFLQTFPQAGNVAGTVSGVTSTLAGAGINALGTKFALQSAGVLGKTGDVASAVGKGAKAAAAAAEAARLAKMAKFARFAKFGGPLAFLASGVEGYATRKASGGGINWGSVFSSGATGAAVSGAAGALFGGIGAVPAAIAGGLISGGGNLLGQLFGGRGQGGPSETGAHNTSGSQGFHQLHSPVPGGARVNAGYGMRTYRGANGKMITGMHHGIDYGIVENTKLYAVDSGTVLKTSKDPKGYGNYTVIQHPDGRQSLYGHLNKFLANPGKKVAAGDVIGLSGGRAGAAGAGNSTGPHLHFEYGSSVGSGNGQMNPQPLFKKGGWLSGLFNAVKGFLGMGPSPRGTTYGTESNINLNKRTGDLSSGDLSSLIGSLTRGSSPINYEDITKRLGPAAAKKIAAQNIDYSKVTGGGQVGHKDLMNLLYRKGFKGKALDTAFAVSLAESGGRTGALGDVNLQTAKWGPSIGLFQIRSLKHWDNYDGKGSKDPWRDGHRLPQGPYNTEAALHKSAHGKDWSAWSTFTSGKFTKFLGDAAATKAALKIPGRYSGGDVKGTTPYVVGEGGPEVFVPDVNGTIIPNAKAKGLGLGAGGKNVVINVKMDVNIAQASPQEAERMIHVFADNLERKLKLHQIGVF
jgi:murein DD-endopeptidase MepM/ murein hydrolase activator NlpD